MVVGRNLGQIEAGVARVVERERVVLRERRAEQPAQFLLVPWRRDDQVRQLALRGQREHALVARAVLSDEAGAVDPDHHGLVVLADVVDGLVEGALEERGIDRDEGPEPAEREAGGERDRVLLGDARRRRSARDRRPGTGAARSRWACPPSSPRRVGRRPRSRAAPRPWRRCTCAAFVRPRRPAPPKGSRRRRRWPAREMPTWA